MNPTPKNNALAEAIRALDKGGEVVKFDAAGKISYSPDIKSGRRILSDSAEEHTRAFIVAHLVKALGYHPSALRLEEAIRARVGRRDGDPRCDLMALNPSGGIHYLMEIKAPDKWHKEKSAAVEGQLFGLAQFCQPSPAHLVYATAEFDKRGKVRVLCDIMDGGKSHKRWKEAGGRIDGNNLAPNFGAPTKREYVRGGENDLAADVGLDELNHIREGLHNVLWGGGGSGDTEVFNFLVRLLLAKIQDEWTTEKGKPYHVQDNADPRVVLERTESRYLDALKRISGRAPEQLSAEKLVYAGDNITEDKFIYAVNRIERLNLNAISETPGARDILGDFFEGIMRTGFKQSKGQFFTHQNIIRFLVYAIELDDLAERAINRTNPALPSIIDPAAGSGAFLVEAMKAVSRAARDRGNRNKRQTENFLVSNFDRPRANEWAKDSCAGLELNPHLGRAAQANMILHSDGSMAMLIADGLAPFSEYPTGPGGRSLLRESKRVPDYARPVNENFDAVLTNPPFAVKFPDQAREKLRATFELADSPSQVLFLERWFQLLKPGGRLGAVLPNSIFDGRKSEKVRKFLLRRFNVRAVVSLPDDAFYPHTTTKTSLLMAEKKTPKERAQAAQCGDNMEALLENNGKIFFAAAAHIGFTRTAKKETPSRNNDLYATDENLNVSLSEKDGSILGRMRREIEWGKSPLPAKWHGLTGANMGRLDAECNLWAASIPEDRRVSVSNYFKIAEQKIVPEENLPARFRYCEIGDVSPNNCIFPEDVNFASPDSGNDEEARLVRKIKDGDIIKPKKGQILVTCVRPYLGKILNVRDDGVYFTKHFVTLEPMVQAGGAEETKRRRLYYALLRGPFLPMLVAYSRWGASYPTLKERDLQNAVVDKKMADDFLSNSENHKLALALEENCDKISEAQRAIAEVLAKLGRTFA